MSNPFFRRTSRRSTLAAVASAAGCALPPGADPDRVVAGLATLAQAGMDELAALDGDDPDGLEDLRATRACACLLPPRHSGAVPAETVALVTDDPDRALRRIADLLDPETLRPTDWRGDATAVHPRALVDAGARLEPGVAVEPGAIVEAGVEIGAGTSIGANSLIAADVRIGRGCAIGHNVTLGHALLGDRVVVHAGARVGVGEPGAPRLGRAIVQDGVEIGANAVVARGGSRDTLVGEGAIVEAGALVPGDATVPRFARVRGPAGQPVG